MMKTSIRFRLNGRPTTLSADADRPLLWALRGELGLTGAKYGCGIGSCGACTVLVAGKAVRACRTALRSVADADVVTIEGLGEAGGLTALQQAFVEHGALQCGYCTPGMLLGAHALLLEHHHPSRAEIAAALESHLCRCGAHQRILDAVEDVARQAGGAP
jgi:aerobic-type carbon monoxide dehydrogenase small subunit (CoxS/CutS family)